MSKMMKSNFSGWKPLTLEGSVFSDAVDGLIGVEELTDYKLEKKNNKTNILICDGEKKKEENKVPTKRKTLNKWQEDDTDEPVSKKVKVKKVKKSNVERKNSKKAQKNQSVKDDLDIDSNNASQVNTDDENVYDIDVQAWSMLGVPAVIIKALKDQQFHSPTTIQSLTLPSAILGRRDILGAAETGSGKTLAFGIPIINGILESKQSNKSDVESVEDTYINNKNKGWICSENKTVESDNSSESDYEDVDDTNENIGCVRVINNIEMNKPQNYTQKPLYALILTPTRELSVQIKDHLTKAAKYTDIKIAVVLGGMAAVKQERILSKGPEIVIATPGRLWELIQQGNPHLNQVDSIKYLAIDETDRMLEKGHFQELQQLLEKINMNKNMLKKRQTFVFSATLTMVHDIPEYLQRKKKKYHKSKISKLTASQKLQKIVELVGIKHPKIVDITKESGTASNLTECRIVCTIDHKDYYLYYFLKRHAGRTLVFCNSIGCVKRLATLFGILECRPLPLHASMQQRQRLKNLERFQADEDGLLIATDVAARGLDIPNVEHVIHYQVPRTSESYVHRSGRTARAQKEGITVLMMEPSEKQNYTKLCKTLDRTDDIPIFPVVDRLLIAVKERVDIARDIDKLELKCRRDNSQKGWLRKAVEDMDLVLEEDEEELELKTKETADLKHQLKVKKRQLESLISKPLFPKGFSGKYPDVNIEFGLSEENQKAVDVMKKVIEDIPKKRKEKSKTSINKKDFLKNKTSKKSKKSKKRL
ncbi:ATP-dependent RNA helicase DDX24 [Hylaeus volcanicus]|uniref:ATP-dependent RNA helicase DDX24 n=1 Tax=Hylaeus volcanicus TaxID=313075 RepID=UPI0023B86859|nr:ATP-dependent RNA helicase DDX24 [Hylaeus volcanicus]